MLPALLQCFPEEVKDIAPTQKQMDNLKKGAAYRFTKENAAEKGRNGQIASQASHRRKKDMYTLTRKVADTRVKKEDLRRQLQDLGLEDEELINAALVVKGVFDNAAAGSIPAVDKWEEFLQRADTAAASVIDRARTTHAYEEFVNYEYDRDRNGNFVSGYPDAKNHLIDATRYALEKQIRQYRSIA